MPSSAPLSHSRPQTVEERTLYSAGLFVLPPGSCRLRSCTHQATANPRTTTRRIPNAIQPDCALLGCSVTTIPRFAAIPTTTRRLVVEVVEAVVVVVVDGSVVVVTEVVAVVGSVVGAVVGTVVAGALVAGALVAGALVVGVAVAGAEVAEAPAAAATRPTGVLPNAAADPKSPTRRTAAIAVPKTAARARLFARRPVVGSTPNGVQSFALIGSPTRSMNSGGRLARSPPQWPAKHIS